MSTPEPSSPRRRKPAPRVAAPAAPAAHDGPRPWGELHLGLLEAVAPPSVVADARGQLLHLSPSAGQFLVTPGGEPSRDLARLVQARLREPLADAWAEAAGGGQRTTRIVDGAADEPPLRLHVVPVQAGQERLFLVAFEALRHVPADGDARQALERSQAELVQALGDAQRARQELEAADAAKDRFLAVLSHELRNPLASIASAAELLLMPKLPAAALEKAARVVQRQVRAMKALLDELLDVSQLSIGRITLTRRPVSIVAVVHSALETVRPLLKAAGHELVLSLPPGTVEVDGDPLRLAQAVANLVGNAARHTPEGGRITVSAQVYEDEVVVSVEDNGIGMEAAEIDRMFDMAPPAHTGPRSNGLGVGLALARNIVELHGGWIMATSAGPGKGSQLRLGLPLLRVAEPPAASAAPAPSPQPLVPALAPEGELILVADDNPDAAWGLAKLLELSGFRAVLARSGEEALAVAEYQRPGIALLDIGMPDLSGHDVARRLRQQPWGRDMILIAATGWGQASDVQRSMEAGFDAHLTKPLNVGRIRGLIEELRKG